MAAGFNLNLKRVFEDYAWEQFKDTSSSINRMLLNRSDFNIYINWADLRFTHETTKFDEIQDDEYAPSEGISVLEVVKDGKRSPKASKDIILYRSKYENKTSLVQEYTFCSTNEAKNTTTIALQDGYTTGEQCNIELTVPNIGKITAGLNRSSSVTETNTTTHETTTSWSVDTKIQVQIGHRVEAKIIVSEKTTMAEFVVKTTMKFVDERGMRMEIRRASDDKLMQAITTTCLKHVFDEYTRSHPELSVEEYIDNSRHIRVKRYKVTILSRGTCQSVSWKNHHVEVNSEEICSHPNVENESTPDD